MRNRTQTKLRVICIVLLFSVTGMTLLLFTQAGTPTVSVEPELGTLTTQASLVSDPSASAGKAIRFNASSPQTGSQPNGIAGNWAMKFDDEFSSMSLDTSKWAPYWFSNGSQSNGTTMNSSNVTESGGYLNLAVNGGAGGTGGLVSTDPNGGAGTGYQFTYGVAEARIYIPASGSKVANWPAWWLDGQCWPEDGEIDIMEGLGGSAEGHVQYGSGCNVDEQGNHEVDPPSPTSYTGWHTFAVDWEAGGITYYYDGKNIGSITNNVPTAAQYLILENSTGAYGLLPATTPVTMQVDYVRVWQH